MNNLVALNRLGEHTDKVSVDIDRLGLPDWMSPEQFGINVRGAERIVK